MTIAYLYRWTEISSGMWYEGSRTKQNCHPDDGYLCSSKKVKPLILTNPDNWQREILLIGEPKFIRWMENRRLVSLDAKNDPQSYNEDNADGKFASTGKQMSDEHRAKISLSLLGKKKPKESIQNYEKANRKKAEDPAFRKKLSHTLSGKPKTEEHKAALSISRKGYKYTGEGLENKRKAMQDRLLGKTYEEIHGVEQAADIKKRQSENLKKYKGDKHHAHGKTYEEILGQEKAEELKKIRSISSKKTWDNAPVLSCDYCDFQSKSSTNMKRWHGANCSKNPHGPRFKK